MESKIMMELSRMYLRDPRKFNRRNLQRTFDEISLILRDLEIVSDG